MIALRTVVRHTGARPSRCLPHFSKLPACRRQKSTVSHHPASPDAQREVPTPFVLVSAAKWSGEASSEQSLSAFVKSFVANGWNVSCIDLDPEGDRAVSKATTSADALARLEAELKEQMRQASGTSPFPPLLASHGLTTLVAESYVSSNPLSGLALFDPPITAMHAHKAHPDKLVTPLDEFTFEIRFPCLVAWGTKRAAELTFFDVHRIEEAREEEAGEALDRYIWDMNSVEEGEKSGPSQLRRWAEENGIPDQEASLLEEEKDEDDDDEDGVANDAEDDEPNAPTRPVTLPAWFTEGSYKRNPTKSKKDPLLLDESHLTESFIRGSGPGGQAINKLSTCVQLTHTPTGTMFRCQDTRSRTDNRMFARRRMSKELERLVFGERDSVLGAETMRAQRKKASKKRKQRRRTESKAAAVAE